MFSVFKCSLKIQQNGSPQIFLLGHLKNSINNQWITVIHCDILKHCSSRYEMKCKTTPWMSNTRCSLKGCSAVGNALLVSPEVKHILSTSNLTRLQSYWLSPEQSISYSQFFVCAMGLKKAKQNKKSHCSSKHKSKPKSRRNEYKSSHLEEKNTTALTLEF